MSGCRITPSLLAAWIHSGKAQRLMTLKQGGAAHSSAGSSGSGPVTPLEVDAPVVGAAAVDPSVGVWVVAASLVPVDPPELLTPLEVLAGLVAVVPSVSPPPPGHPALASPASATIRRCQPVPPMPRPPRWAW